MSNKIPTTEEFFKKYSNLLQFEEGDPEYLIDKEDFEKALIRFAQHHVQEALKAASENVEVIEYNTGFSGNASSVNHESILNAYSIENIK